MANKERDPSIDEFINECKEILERVSSLLQKIEKSNGHADSEELSALYRDVHTIKGTSQLFGYNSIGSVAHAMETCLDPIRKKNSLLTPRLIESCFKVIDLMDRLLKQIDKNQTEVEIEKNSKAEIISVVSRMSEAASDIFGIQMDLIKEHSIVEIAEKKENANVLEIKPAQSKQNIAAVEPALNSVANNATSVTASTAVHGVSAADSSIRVQVALLDRVLNLVGELVLVRNQLMQGRSRFEDPEFLAASKSLDVVTSELQSEVMKTRMQPLEAVLSKFQRLVREIARDLDKKIDLTLEGSDTELDKSLLEAVKDPLTHIIRNSCDHGIENPKDRHVAGKPETGHILIRSYYEGGQVVIEISDDGKGLRRKSILDKAIEKGVVSQEIGLKMSDHEICQLIFAPGFSTAETVTSVSGRGVGMDVVKTNIEKIGGSVQLTSIEGKGTNIRLKIPLTLAIVPALLIKSGQCTIAIPQVKLVELVRVSEESAVKIEYLQGKPLCRLRGALLPLLDLNSITSDGTKFSNPSSESLFVVVDADGEKFGLLVDDILDTADIVVKPLGALLKNISIYSGATILGDGSIALILDIIGVGTYGKVIGRKTKENEKEVFSKDQKQIVNLDVQEFLLLSLGMGVIHAIPLCLVNRLEEFQKSSIEYSGEQRVILYRGALLPVISIKESLNYKDLIVVNDTNLKELNIKGEQTSIVVVNRSGKFYGFEVDQIMDIIAIEGSIDDAIRDRFGILGNIVHQNNVVVIVDVFSLIDQMNAKLGVKKNETENSIDDLKNIQKKAKLKNTRVLYAEDVSFFRKHVSKVLNDAGIDVTTVEDGAKALEELLNSSRDKYNIILSDIEMPKMDGYELAREIRKQDRFKNIPLVALTTRFSERDKEEGRAAGFDGYLEKLNPEKLLAKISNLIELQTGEKLQASGEMRA